MKHPFLGSGKSAHQRRFSPFANAQPEAHTYLRTVTVCLLLLFTLASTPFTSSLALAQTCTPTFVASYGDQERFYGVYVSGNTAYVADIYGLRILDVTNPASPYLLGSFGRGFEPLDVYVSGSTAYLACFYNGLVLIDVTNSASPSLLGIYNPPGELAYSVCVSGGTAYVAYDYSGLQIIDVSDPSAPALLGSYNTVGPAFDVYVSGNMAYVANGLGLQIIDVTNPSSPSLLGWYETPGVALGVYVSGNTAYVADGYYGLQIIDVTDPTSPSLLANYETPGYPEDVYVSGNTAYVADVLSLQIIDITDPTSPSLLANYETPGYAERVYVSGNTAYVVGEYNGLQILDVTGCGGTPSEDCTNGIDDDADGLLDCDDPDCGEYPACLCQCPDGPKGCISGAVMDLEGNPVVGSRVWLITWLGEWRFWSTLTESSGCYTFTRLPDWFYFVAMRRECSLSTESHRVVIQDGAKVNHMDFVCGQ